jgi:hypothetical protein
MMAAIAIAIAVASGQLCCLAGPQYRDIPHRGEWNKVAVKLLHQQWSVQYGSEVLAGATVKELISSAPIYVHENLNNPSAA